MSDLSDRIDALVKYYEDKLACGQKYQNFLCRCIDQLMKDHDVTEFTVQPPIPFTPEKTVSESGLEFRSMDPNSFSLTLHPVDSEKAFTDLEKDAIRLTR